jgi:lysozyme
MKTSDNGRKLIEGFEGLILQAYDDHNDKIVQPGEKPIGTLTIGYGHTGSDVTVGEKITKDQADQLLSKDLAGAEKDVNILVKVPLNQNQYDALVSFQFNTGWLAHQHCSLLSALNSGNYNLADEDFMLYDRAQGVVLAGLDRRRAAEKALFNTPYVAPKPDVVTVSYTRIPMTTGTVAGSVAAVSTVAVTRSPDHFWYIAIGVVIAGILADIIYHKIMNRKVITNVA